MHHGNRLNVPVAGIDFPNTHGGLDFGNLDPKFPTQLGGNSDGPSRHQLQGQTFGQQRYQDSLKSRFQKLSKEQQDALFRKPDQLAKKGKDFLGKLPPDVLGQLPVSN
jgi:hypothetical protein